MTDLDESISRMTAWLRDYGKHSTTIFCEDLTTVLKAAIEADKWRAELEKARKEIERLKQ